MDQTADQTVDQTGALTDTSPQFGPATVGTLLLQEIARTATPAQQIALLDHWRETSRKLLADLSNTSYGDPVWQRLAWKRDLVVELITSLNNILLAARRLRAGTELQSEGV